MWDGLLYIGTQSSPKFQQQKEKWPGLDNNFCGFDRFLVGAWFCFMKERQPVVPRYLSTCSYGG